MTPILLLVVPLVVLLCVLIVKINNGEHYAPQAYHRRKRGGAPVFYDFESLGPRARKSPPGWQHPAAPAREREPSRAGSP